MWWAPMFEMLQNLKLFAWLCDTISDKFGMWYYMINCSQHAYGYRNQHCITHLQSWYSESWDRRVLTNLAYRERPLLKTMTTAKTDILKINTELPAGLTVKWAEIRMDLVFRLGLSLQCLTVQVARVLKLKHFWSQAFGWGIKPIYIPLQCLLSVSRGKIFKHVLYI